MATGRLELPVAGGPAGVREQPGVKSRVYHLAAHAAVLSGRAQARVLCPALWAAPCAKCCPAALARWPLGPAAHDQQPSHILH